jgi:biopolymer transport protein ExbD/biopolymer transport protein TolR
MAAKAPRKKRDHKKRRPVGQPEPDINVTPLVDIVLVLLIIFMVVTPALAQGETIELPQVGKIDARPKDVTPIKVVLSAGGATLLEGKRYELPALEQRLRALHDRTPDRGLLLNTDSKVPYVRVRTMLASLQAIGFKGVSLKVQPKKHQGD